MSDGQDPLRAAVERVRAAQNRKTKEDDDLYPSIYAAMIAAGGVG